MGSASTTVQGVVAAPGRFLCIPATLPKSKGPTGTIILRAVTWNSDPEKNTELRLGVNIMSPSGENGGIPAGTTLALGVGFGEHGATRMESLRLRIDNNVPPNYTLSFPTLHVPLAENPDELPVILSLKRLVSKKSTEVIAEKTFTLRELLVAVDEGSTITLTGTGGSQSWNLKLSEVCHAIITMALLVFSFLFLFGL